MKLLPSLCISALLAASATAALADTITLASYGSTATTPTGVGNTATDFLGGWTGSETFAAGPSYSIGTGGIWAAPTGNSSWVSNSPQNFPGGSNVEPTGVYVYSTSFYDADAAGSTGSITVMADDTAAIYLNDVLITLPASSGTLGTCDSGQPNCTAPATYTLTGFQQGENTITFGVLQEHGYAEGLDYSGSVNVTPEPNSMLLMATGLLAGGVLLYRRRLTA